MEDRVKSSVVGLLRLEHDSDRCGAEAASKVRDGMPRRRPALVVLTDGFDEHSAANLADLLSIARQMGASLFPVGFGGIARAWHLRGPIGDENRGKLEAIARVTGGQVTSELPSWHEVEVRVRRPR